MKVDSFFLGWDKPIVQLAVKRLTKDWKPSPILDLSNLLIVVPTKQSGRRLREGIARFAAENNAGVLPPKTVTPDFFIRPENDINKVASTVESTAAWAETLMTSDISKLTALFPKNTENKQDSKWALSLAEKISRLRTLLSENGLLISDLVKKDSDNIEELPRWENLTTLEKEYLSKLHKVGLEDIHKAKIENLGKNINVDGIELLIILAVPDPTPLSLKAIEIVAKKVPIEIWIHAPENFKYAFDKWGRPIPDEWAKIEIPFSDDKEYIRLRGDAQSQADDVVNILLGQQKDLDVNEFSIAAPNTNLIPFIKKAFITHNIEVYNPAGESITTGAMFQLVNSFGRLLSTKQYDDWSSLLRNSDMLRYISKKEDNFNQISMLTQLDKFQNAHMPNMLNEISFFLQRYTGNQFKDLRIAHEIIMKFIAQFNNTKPLEFMRTFLAEIYKGYKIDPSVWGNTKQSDTAFVISKIVDEMDSPIFKTDRMSSSLQMDILFKTLKQKKIYPEHSERAIPVQGWLEMPWEEAEIVIIAGMNEGFVPDSVVGDIFLPDLPRKKLGLHDNSNRFARDSYLLTSMISSRPNGGVYCIVGKQDVSNDPLKPSRLLFRCSNDKLLYRAKLLFQELSEPDSEIIPPDYQWKLKPEMSYDINHMSATAFKEYLACPFRFYLKRALHMTHLDDRKTEADAMEFGNACHIPLEKLGKNKKLSGCKNKVELARFLKNEATKFMENKFGKELPLAISVQLDTIKKRLAKAAEIEAQIRDEGWKTIATEYEFGNGKGIEINGMKIVGKIDRIDIKDNLLRIIDYKTGDTPKGPLQAHIKNANCETLDCAFFEVNNKEKAWIDLQLPLYYIALTKDCDFLNMLNIKYNIKQLEIHCGYFMLPKSLDETGLKIWEDLNNYYIDAAEECLNKVINCVKNKEFWPPSENIKYDEFAYLHIGSLKDAIEINNYGQYQFRF